MRAASTTYMDMVISPAVRRYEMQKHAQEQHSGGGTDGGDDGESQSPSSTAAERSFNF